MGSAGYASTVLCRPMWSMDPGGEAEKRLSLSWPLAMRGIKHLVRHM